jgi:hypothetical protein
MRLNDGKSSNCWTVGLASPNASLCAGEGGGVAIKLKNASTRRAASIAPKTEAGLFPSAARLTTTIRTTQRLAGGESAVREFAKASPAAPFLSKEFARYGAARNVPPDGSLRRRTHAMQPWMSSSKENVERRLRL